MPKRIILFLNLQKRLAKYSLREYNKVTDNKCKPFEGGEDIGQMNYFKLRSTRLQLGKTQEDMAKLLNIKQSQYSKRENGEIDFTINQASVIAKYFGLKLEQIFFD